ncbi:MAG: hypothetical protein JSR68_08230 [Proteobacteria bacterium]|nr:hypothetical protein [Pseudomonadota bacterium]
MGVKIAAINAAVTAAATVYLPGDRGQQIAHPFEVQFKRLPRSQQTQLNQWHIAGERPEPADGPRAAERDDKGNVPFDLSELLDAIVCGWSGFADEAGLPVPYSHAERRATEEAYPGIEQSMAVAWYDTMWVNQREAKEKNSVRPSPAGSASAARAST